MGLGKGRACKGGRIPPAVPCPLGGGVHGGCGTVSAAAVTTPPTRPHNQCYAEQLFAGCRDCPAPCAVRGEGWARAERTNSLLAAGAPFPYSAARGVAYTSCELDPIVLNSEQFLRRTRNGSLPHQRTRSIHNQRSCATLQIAIPGESGVNGWESGLFCVILARNVDGRRSGSVDVLIAPFVLWLQARICGVDRHVGGKNEIVKNGVCRRSIYAGLYGHYVSEIGIIRSA